MLKTAMCGSRINKIRESQLVNVPEPLERSGIENLSFVRVQPNKYVNGVTDFMNGLDHKSSCTKKLAFFSPAGQQTEVATLKNQAVSAQFLNARRTIQVHPERETLV
jgi:hypothetical protein